MPKFKHSSLKKVLNCCQYYLFSSNGVVFTNKVKTLPGFSFTMPPVIKLNFQVFVGLDDFNTFFVFPWNDQLISPQTSCIMGSCNWSGWLRRDNNAGVGRSDCVPDKRFKEKKKKTLKLYCLMPSWYINLKSTRVQEGRYSDSLCSENKELPETPERGYVAHLWWLSAGRCSQSQFKQQPRLKWHELNRGKRTRVWSLLGSTWK